MEKLKVAVIGVGSISGNHIAGYKNNPNVELVAFCDINKARLVEQGALHGITNLFESVDEMFKAMPEIQAVSVCTWNSAHAECTIKALNAGKDVLCEKPMAMNVAEAESMRQTAIKNGRKLMIGFVRRYGNDCDIVKDFVSAGTFGDIYYTKAQYLRRNGNPGGWFGDKSRSGGGPLIDLGVHVIDLVRYIMGNPKAVSVYGATFQKLGNRSDLKDKKGYVSISSKGKEDICDVEDLATALIRFDNGAVLNIEASFSLNIKEDTGKIELFGSKGGAKLDPDLEIYNETNGYMTDIKLKTASAIDFSTIFQDEINHFVDVCTLNTPMRAPAEDGVEMMKILGAIYESAKTQHEVILK